MKFREISEQLPVAGAVVGAAAAQLADPAANQRLTAAQLAQQNKVKSETRKNLQIQIQNLEAQLRALRKQLSDLNRTP